jgi:hypothetical protein
VIRIEGERAAGLLERRAVGGGVGAGGDTFGNWKSL